MRKMFKFISIALSLLLLCSSLGLAAVTASFTANVTEGDAPLAVHFNSTSINATSLEWNFDDGSGNSTDSEFDHIFTDPGTYDVVLTAYEGNNSSSTSTTITVNSVSTGVNASFDTNVTDGDAPLTVLFTSTSTNASSLEWDVDDGGANVTASVFEYTFTDSGTYDVTLTAYNGTESSSTSKTITVNSVSTGVSASFDTNVTEGDKPLSVLFTSTSVNASSLEWDFDDGSGTYSDSELSHEFTDAGTYDVVLTAYNGTESSTASTTITVNEPTSTAPDASFTTNVTEGPVSLIVQFNDTSTNTPTSWSWDFNDDGTEDSTLQNPVYTFTSTGTYNVTLAVEKGADSDTASTTITVYSKNYVTGDRIWDENADQSEDYYIWDAKSFSGFFYDLESGLSSENMTIRNIDRSIDDGDIIYQTRPVETDFDHSDWGSYQVIGFMAEKYFAAYTDDTDIDVDEVSMMSSGQLSKILIDDDDKESVFAGSSLTLEDGYDLNIAEVDVNGNSVLVTLTKDGDELDTGIVESNDDYIYETDIGDADDVAIIIVHFDDVFSGTESNAVFIEGIFQISDEYLELDDGSNFGEMEITSISDELIEMENEDSVSLSKGDSIELMGKINLIVADNSDLRFAPYVDMTDPGTYELRGTVVEGTDLLTWTPLNFEGFYYDIDEGIQTETLELEEISGRTIPSRKLVYNSVAKSVEFEHSEWGEFEVIGFVAQKFFVGFDDDNTTIDGVNDVSLLSNGYLSEVLTDDDEKVSVFSGSSLQLEEGYSLDIVEVDTNGDRVLVELYLDGDEVDTGIASSGSDYVYETDLGDADDVPLIIVHFDEVFRGTESNAVFVQGIFQISDDYIELESGDNYDEMEITSFNDDSITMKNDDSISLSKDDDIELMGNVGIRVADSSTVRYYPYVERVVAASETLSIDLSSDTVVEDEEVIITVTSRGGSVGEVTVKVDGTTIGTTEDDGTLAYTFSTAGTFEITAEKDNYATGSKDIEIIDEDDETKKMSIEVSPDEVYEGTSMTIFVLQAIGGEGIDGAEVSLDGKSIGTTGSDGTVTYTATETGTHKITATKSGLIEAELDVKVQEQAAKFVYSNLEISPLEIKQGQEATISANIVNSGTANGSFNVELKINDVVVDSQLVSLDIDQSTVVEFTHEEEEMGTYKAQIGDLSKEYEVFEKSGVVLYILGAVALAAIGGVGYLFTAGGWTVEIAQAKVSEAIEALKELVGNLR